MAARVASSRGLGILVAVSALLLGAIPTSAQGVACGATVTESITLTGDLICEGTALYVASATEEPITVDLGGHTVLSVLDCISCGTIEGVVQNGRVAVVAASGSGWTFYTHGSTALLQNLVIDGGAVARSAAGFHTTVRDSTFVNGAVVRCYDTNMRVEGNHFVDGPADGRAIQGRGCWMEIRSNTISGYGSAIALSYLWHTGATVVADNLVVGGGISVDGDYSGDAIITGNLVGYAPGHGISVTGRDRFDPKAFTVAGNAVVSSGGDGIHVVGTPNVAITLAGNETLGNAGLGIRAVEAVDGGGNRASGNGDPLQCEGVACGSAACGLGGEVALLLAPLMRRRARSHH